MKKKKKKVRIKFKNIFIVLTIVVVFSYTTISFINQNITNIYIKGNSIYSDQEIIRLANLENYPRTFTNSTKKIKKRLEKDTYINEAIITKKYFTKVYIEIIENYPLYYYNDKTVLYNGKIIKEQLDSPILVNEIPSKIQEKFDQKLRKVDREIIERMSEIKYDPDHVDEERFLITMNDGNYVYITLSKTTEINKYLTYVKEFNNRKGILYLNSGEYFKTLED